MVFMPLEKFLEILDCVEEYKVWLSFGIKKSGNKIPRDPRIQIKNEYMDFTGKPRKSKMKKKIFLKLANVEKDKEDDNS